MEGLENIANQEIESAKKLMQEKETEITHFKRVIDANIQQISGSLLR